MNKNISGNFSIERFAKVYVDESLWVAKWFNMNGIGFSVYDYCVNVMVAGRMGIQIDQAEYLGEFFKKELAEKDYLLCLDYNKADVDRVVSSVLNKKRKSLEKRLDSLTFEEVEMSGV